MRKGRSPVGTIDPSFNRPYGTRIYISRLFPGTACRAIIMPSLTGRPDAAAFVRPSRVPPLAVRLEKAQAFKFASRAPPLKRLRDTARSVGGVFILYSLPVVRKV